MLELLTSRDRLAREAALDALIARPLPALRDTLRELYADLDADGLKRDQGAPMRVAIVRILKSTGDVRDADIAVRACDTKEKILEADVSWQLRTHGLRMLVELSPALFPYIAAEHLDDVDLDRSEPANTALQLLAGTNNHALIYQWLISGEHAPAMVAPVFELLRDAPREVLSRYVARAINIAIRTADDTLAIVIAEAIVGGEMETRYDALGELMSAKISDELYTYLAVLLAATNRAPLLTILEKQLHGGRRPRAIEDALRIRTTPEQEAILKRWEDGDELPA